MPLTPDEKRLRAREKKARQRARSRESGHVAPVTDMHTPRPTRMGTSGGTRGGTATVPPVPPPAHADERPPALAGSNEAAAIKAIAALEIPDAMGFLADLVVTLAKDLDGAENVPQRANLASRYVEMMTKLAEASKTKEVSKLDTLRTQFWNGGAQSGGSSRKREA